MKKYLVILLTLTLWPLIGTAQMNLELCLAKKQVLETRVSHFYFENLRLKREKRNLLELIDIIEADQCVEADPVEVDPAEECQQASQSVIVNLNLSAVAQEPAAFTVEDPEGTSNYRVDFQVFDSLCVPHDLRMYLRKTAIAREWEFYVLANGVEITGDWRDLEIEADGTLRFNGDGSLSLDVTNASDFDFVTAFQNQAIVFDFRGTTQRGLEYRLNSLDVE